VVVLEHLGQAVLREPLDHLEPLVHLGQQVVLEEMVLWVYQDHREMQEVLALLEVPVPLVKVEIDSLPPHRHH
jgi:hypothetical protein